MTFLSGVLQKYCGLVLEGRGKNLTRRDSMGTLIFGAGTLLGLCLGILMISLLTMAQRTGKF